MNFNTDGFNERTNYIHNSNDVNRVKLNEASNIDSSFAKMKMDERKANIQTVVTDKTFIKEDVSGSKDDFIIRNNNMMNANRKINSNNPVRNAMNKNAFRKF